MLRDRRVLSRQLRRKNKFLRNTIRLLLTQYGSRTSKLMVKLTKREFEVLNLVMEGKSSREVADELFCSKRTVDFHLARIYEKLQVSNRVQAMRQATILGLVEVKKEK